MGKKRQRPLQKRKTPAVVDEEDVETALLEEALEQAKRARPAVETPANGANASEQADAPGGSGSSSDEDDDDDDEDLFLDSERADGAGEYDEDEDGEGEDDTGGVATAGSGAGAAGADEKVTNVEFCFVDPRDIHFKSVRELLKTLVPSAAALDLSALSDAVVGQKCVGTVLSVVGDEDDAYGVLTALPLRQLKGNVAWKELRKFLLQRCPAPAMDAFAAALSTDAAESSSVGLLLSQRLVNLPLQIAPPLLAALVEDMQWAKAEGVDFERRDFSAMTHVLYVCPATAEGDAVARLPRQTVDRVTEQCYFHRFEDEILLERSDASFAFASPAGIGKGSANTRVVMLLSISALEEASAAVAAALSAMQ